MNNPEHTQDILYPYLPAGFKFLYVPIANRFMLAAKAFALTHSLDKTMPTGSTVVKDNTILGEGANGSDYHETHGCERVRLNIPTGEGYDLCEGCHPKNHSEPRAVLNALSRVPAADLQGFDLYLWGHWWCCESCWQTMLNAGVRQIYLLENSHILYNKEAKGNIVGRQYEIG